ncbi:MAG: YsnF/AvaK domain-containing protein [Steroidobacter sp.]
MSIRTITAIFESPADAQEAQARLLSLGLPESDVRLVKRSAEATADGEDKGFWESIKDFFVADEDRPAYAEGLRRGGCLLTATVDDEQTDEAIAILEASNAVDLDERTEQWRSEGWTGAEYASEPASAGRDTARIERDIVETNPAMQTTARVATERSAEMEEAIPIVREQLRVGKREVNRGGVRVRSYVVEEPVDEQVELREERVEVERRPVGRAAAAGDASDLLQERTVEVTERAEEAVVAKEAEVTEEVVVRKFEGHRTEGVSDTVRHTEVEVEDTRTDQFAPPPKRDTLGRGRSSDSKPAR